MGFMFCVVLQRRLKNYVVSETATLFNDGFNICICYYTSPESQSMVLPAGPGAMTLALITFA